MPNWNAVLKEIEKTVGEANATPIDIVRRRYLAKLHQHTGRNVIAYYSEFVSNPKLPACDINDDDKNGFMLCCQKLDKSKGLDLILHTGGGDVGAVESIVFYLHQMFGHDVRAIIPGVAMSAGAMIACACKEIVMGKHSAIGPVDPQLEGLPAIGVLQEFNRATKETAKRPSTSMVWDPILSRLSPSFLEQCRWAVARSEAFLAKALREGMMRDDQEPERTKTIKRIVAKLTSKNANLGHNRHIHYDECQEMGLKIRLLEDPVDREFQDLVLTVHHTFMHTLHNTPAIKVIEDHRGRAQVRIVLTQQPVMSYPEEMMKTMKALAAAAEAELQGKTTPFAS